MQFKANVGWSNKSPCLSIANSLNLSHKLFSISKKDSDLSYLVPKIISSSIIFRLSEN